MSALPGARRAMFFICRHQTNRASETGLQRVKWDCGQVLDWSRLAVCSLQTSNTLWCSNAAASLRGGNALHALRGGRACGCSECRTGVVSKETFFKKARWSGTDTHARMCCFASDPDSDVKRLPSTVLASRHWCWNCARCRTESCGDASSASREKIRSLQMIPTNRSPELKTQRHRIDFLTGLVRV